MQAYRSGRASVLALVLAAAAARANPTLAQSAVPMKATVTVAGRTETLRGTGQCGHEPRAWLHGAPAALWVVQYAGAEAASNLSLSYWRIAGAGGEKQEFSVAVHGRKASHRISTIRGGKLEGSGRVTFRPTASGGRFEIVGKAQSGAALQATIECARFGGIHAEGG